MWLKHSLLNEVSLNCGWWFCHHWWRQYSWGIDASFAFALLLGLLYHPEVGCSCKFAHFLAKFCVFRGQGEAEDANGESFLLNFLWIILLGMISVASIEVEKRCAWGPIWGCCIHFPWRSQPNGWGYLQLCFLPGEHHMVEKILLDTQPQQNLQRFRSCVFGTFL